MAEIIDVEAKEIDIPLLSGSVKDSRELDIQICDPDKIRKLMDRHVKEN